MILKDIFANSVDPDQTAPRASAPTGLKNLQEYSADDVFRFFWGGGWGGGILRVKIHNVYYVFFYLQLHVRVNTPGPCRSKLS